MHALGFPCAQESLASFPRLASVPRATGKGSTAMGLLGRDSSASQSQKPAENHGAGSNLAHS